MSFPTRGSEFAQKYRLDRHLAHGGMGAVWVARHLKLDSLVAIKLMSPECLASPALRARFEREAKAAAQLRSPHVVQIHDYGVEDGIPYIVMELLEGEDLGARLKRVRRLAMPAAATILTQAAKALHRAHEMGIVHRDLKPTNVFVARADDDEIVKLLDFGIAKAMASDGSGDESTATGAVLGSPNYMSPEQARGLKEVDHRSDLWSLSVILYRMLTGEVPFRGAGTGDLIVRICTDPIAAPSSIVADLPPSVDSFFLRALARDPEKRFQSARELAVTFANLVSGRASLPDSTGMRATDTWLSFPAMPGPESTEIGAILGESSAPFPLASSDVAARHRPPLATPLEHGAAVTGRAEKSAREPSTLTGAGSQETQIDRRALPRILWGAGLGTFGLVLLVGVILLRSAGSSGTDAAGPSGLALTSAAQGAAPEPTASGPAQTAPIVSPDPPPAVSPAPPGEPTAPIASGAPIATAPIASGTPIATAPIASGVPIANRGPGPSGGSPGSVPSVTSPPNPPAGKLPKKAPGRIGLGL
jgi:eukaryotic-like serine/threonine-protein kinase